MAEEKIRYLLRVEGVNLDNFVYDTDDLSTVRGGGLLLLGGVNRVLTTLKGSDPGAAPISTGAESISTGASVGLFEFEATDGAMVRDDIAKVLATDSALQHATFVVDVVPASGDFLADRERLVALNRFRQVRSPSLAVPKRVTNGKVTKACVVDLVRPGDDFGTFKDKHDQPMSRSVKARRDHGVKQKQKFYVAATRDPNTGQGDPGGGGMTFVHDFESLASDETKGDVESHGNLNRKMAVIWVDGNHFGRTQDELCRTPSRDPIAMQISFDTKLKGLRREALKAQLTAMQAKSKQWTNRGEYRFETLLWGGDEFCWVVPAWCGWETLARFFGLSKAWSIENKPLTHAAGLVFCHHKAPIRRVKDLAHDLAELAKEKSRDDSLCAYQVLESFDDIPHDLEAFRASRCVRGASPKTLVVPETEMAMLAARPQHAILAKTLIVPGTEMTHMAGTLQNLKDVVPKSRLVRLVGELQRGDKTAADADLKELLGLIGASNTQEVETLESRLGSAGVAWFHLAELWDYLPDAQSPSKGDKS